MGKTAALSAGAAGIGALTFAIKTGVSEWMNQQKVAAQTNAVIKSTGGIANVTAKHVQSLASKIEHYSGIDDEAIKSTENLLLAFTGVRNEVGKGNDIFDRAIKVITDYSVRTGKNAAGATQLFGKALNEIAQGQVPTSIRGIGKLSKGLQDEIKAHIKAGDAAGAQGLLLKELERRYGGAAKAAGETLPGQLAILHERFNDLAGEGVQLAIDKFKELEPTFKTIVDIIRGLSPVLKPLISLWFDAIVTPIKVITDLLRGDFSQAWEDIKKPIQDVEGVFTGLGTIVSNLAGDLWGKFSSTFQSVFVTPFETAWDNVAGWFTSATGFVTKTAGYVGGLPKEAWGKFTALFDSVFVTPFKSAFDAVANWIIGPDGFVTKAAGFIASLPSKITDFGGALLTRIQTIFGGAGVGGWITGVVSDWAGFIGAIPDKIADFSKALLTTVSKFVTDAGIGTWLSGKVDDFAAFFGALPGKIATALSSGVTGTLAKIKGWFNDLFGWLPKWAKDILGIASPSKVFTEIGEHIVGGLIKGLGNMAGALKAKIEELIGAPVDWAKKAIGAIAGVFTGGHGAGSPQANRALGAALAQDRFGWGPNEFASLDPLWIGESGWNQFAKNPDSGAYGIPQALPPTKMPFEAQEAGGSSPYAQIMWGLGYIKSVYGDPINAYQAWLSRSPHWYAKGGVFTKPSIIGVGEAGPEAVIPLSKMQGGGDAVFNITLEVDGEVLWRKMQRQGYRYQTANGSTGFR